MDERAWYATCAQTLRLIGGGEPRLLLDLDRLQVNLHGVLAALPPGRKLRLVQKSLPSMALLRWLQAQPGARQDAPRLMIFHRPWLNLYAAHWPEADLLLGKPMPAQAAQAFYEAFDARSGFDPREQLHWLIDTDARLAQYQRLAQQRRTRLSIALEIDVGLRRGGFADARQMRAALARIQADPAHLKLAGLMGYDAHAAKAPPWVGARRAVEQANARYRAFLRALRQDFPELAAGLRFCNGAGSPTALMHGADSPLDELAIGSGLVKPTDFDVPALAALQPAALIAAPVLKVLDGCTMPFLEGLSAWASRLLPGRSQSIFLYGGRWMARPVWPAGLRSNALYGLSSNQQLMNLDRATPVAVDEIALFRPTQSEAVFTQFGALWGLRGNALERTFAPDPL